MDPYDYIVVGGGTAGSVLAARLSEDPGVTVLLVEAGPMDGPPEMADPGRFPALMGGPVDWKYTTVAQPGTDMRVHDWARGRVLGGSSSINAMAHLRGHASNYDGWAADGAPGWSYAELLPYFRRSEDAPQGDPRYRGTGGPMRVGPVADRSAGAEAFLDAIVQAGFPATGDISGADQQGAFWYDMNVVDGRRQSAADGYLRPVLDRPNLRISPASQARRLIIKDHRCTGVEFSVDGEVHEARAGREVILSAGAIGSPQLLMLSGIGPAGHLRPLGIEVVADLPGVGSNLQDHLQSTVVYSASQPLRTSSSGFCPVSALLPSGPRQATPDVQLLLLDFPTGSDAPETGYTISFALLSPASRGTVRLRSSDPARYPLIDPNYLADDRDLETLVAGLRIARRVGAAPALAKWRRAEHTPGDDADLREHIRRTARTYFHPVGTCKMGTDDLAVVTPDLTVRGVAGLRVADAAVMPTVVTANPNATVLAIAERAAALIAGDRRV